MNKKMRFLTVFFISLLLSPAVFAQQDKQGTIKLTSKEDIANFEKALGQKIQQPQEAVGTSECGLSPAKRTACPGERVIDLPSYKDINKFEETALPAELGLAEAGNAADSKIIPPPMSVIADTSEIVQSTQTR